VEGKINRRKNGTEQCEGQVCGMYLEQEKGTVPDN